MSLEFMPGRETFYASDSPTSGYSVVFEDDGRTGYAYPYDRGADPPARILDACHLYNAANVVDHDRASKVEVIWTADGLKAALLINGRAHAVIDFAAKHTYCRTNFPAPTGPWRARARIPWNDDIMKEFGP
jgi:hypothetical protein